MDAQLFGGQLKSVKVGRINTILCSNATNNGTLKSGTISSGVSTNIPYSGGNGGPYQGKAINSTGITGLTATLVAGNFAVGDGNLLFTISGTPNTSGIANFTLNIGGQSCTFSRTVYYPVNAGPDQCYVDGTTIVGGGQCGQPNGIAWLRVFLSPSPAPSGATVQWSIGSNGKPFCGPSGTTYTFLGKPGGSYTIRYTITINGVSSFDEVNVCFNNCKNYTITRSGGTNQYTYNYVTCSGISSGGNTIANGATTTICAFPGSVTTNYPQNIFVYPGATCY